VHSFAEEGGTIGWQESELGKDLNKERNYEEVC